MKMKQNIRWSEQVERKEYYWENKWVPPAPPYPSFLHFPGGHHNDAWIFLPCHLPEIIDGGIQATLASNIGFIAFLRTEQAVL